MKRPLPDSRQVTLYYVVYLYSVFVQVSTVIILSKCIDPNLVQNSNNF